MYSDRMLRGDPDPLLNETEGPMPTECSSPQPKERPRRLPQTRIMVLGPSGSGKSSLIKLLSNEDFPVASEGIGLCTTRFWTTKDPIVIDGRPFRLIDSPGFNTSAMSNSEVMKKMVADLAKSRTKYNARLSGVIYLHPQGSDLACEKLKQNLEALTHIFGEPWLPYFTIAVVGSNAAAESDVVHDLQDPASPFYALHMAGAKFRYLPFEPSHIKKILSEFSRDPPPDTRFDSKVRWAGRIFGLESFMDEVLASLKTPVVKRAGRPTRITLEESEVTRQQLQTTLDETNVELNSLRSQLEQTQLEYASLRSELQLNDNTEQSKIVQSLQDLNRAIDDFGRNVAEIMVDNYTEGRFKNDNPTTLDASDFTELQRQFGHQVGKSSLVASFNGDGLPIEDFIDLALRNFLCQKLCKNVFAPFHPALATSAEPNFMVSLYEEVRRQASPTIAAKWRASSFIALSKGNKLDKPIIEEQVEALVAGDIQQLFNNLFGQEDTVVLTESQREQLQGVVTMAWELNYMLKGEVITLGDFQPLYHERGVPFDPKTMLEFEASKKKKPGDVAICTIRLGLSLFYSKGAGKDAGPLVICPATVVTPTVYGN